MNTHGAESEQPRPRAGHCAVRYRVILFLYTACIRDLDLTLVKVANLLFLGRFSPIIKQTTYFDEAPTLTDICLSFKSIHKGRFKIVQIPNIRSKRLYKLKKDISVFFYKPIFLLSFT